MNRRRDLRIFRMMSIITMMSAINITPPIPTTRPITSPSFSSDFGPGIGPELVLVVVVREG